MISETGANIMIRGKGSKRGYEDEPLHAYVTSTNPEAVKKAVDKIRNIIKELVDLGANRLLVLCFLFQNFPVSLSDFLIIFFLSLTNPISL